MRRWVERHYDAHAARKHLEPRPLAAISAGSRLQRLIAPAGHILGASHIILQAAGRRVVFSGDLGRLKDLIMRPRSVIERVLDHLKRFGPDARNMIVLVGYQAGGTRGAALLQGARELGFRKPLWQIFLTHGDPSATDALRLRMPSRSAWPRKFPAIVQLERPGSGGKVSALRSIDAHQRGRLPAVLKFS